MFPLWSESLEVRKPSALGRFWVRQRKINAPTTVPSRGFLSGPNKVPAMCPEESRDLPRGRQFIEVSQNNPALAVNTVGFTEFSNRIKSHKLVLGGRKC